MGRRGNGSQACAGGWKRAEHPDPSDRRSSAARPSQLCPCSLHPLLPLQHLPLFRQGVLLQAFYRHAIRNTQPNRAESSGRDAERSDCRNTDCSAGLFLHQWLLHPELFTHPTPLQMEHEGASAFSDKLIDFRAGFSSS